MNRSILICLTALFSAPLFAQPPAGASMSDMFIQQLDGDKDGKVSKAEFLKPQEMQFAHIDTNGDGNLDKAEVEAFAQKMQQKMEQMRQQQGAPGQQPPSR